jgi:hypothetical protein
MSFVSLLHECCTTNLNYQRIFEFEKRTPLVMFNSELSSHSSGMAVLCTFFLPYQEFMQNLNFESLNKSGCATIAGTLFVKSAILADFERIKKSAQKAEL